MNIKKIENGYLIHFSAKNNLSKIIRTKPKTIFYKTVEEVSKKIVEYYEEQDA